MKGQGERFPGEGCGQVKPGKPRGWRSMPGEMDLLLRKPDEPTGRRGLREHHGQRRLVELNQRAAIGVAGKHEVAAEFRQTAFGPPERLALLNVPAGTGGREQILGCRLAAAEKHERGQRN